MKIATWNVNSLNVRLPHVLDFLNNEDIDVLGLQETKLEDIKFPKEAFTELGYHCEYFGQKTYNGVALISRQSLVALEKNIPQFEDAQCRVIKAIYRDICIINVYIPNGQSIDSDKYHYKLNWLKALHAYLQDIIKHHTKVILMGDFNIAPHDLDVHDPKLWQDQVLVSIPEREAFGAICDLGLKDAYRELNPMAQDYTWWDYRQAAFRRNLGLRIDHILVTDALLNSTQTIEIAKSYRMLERPSDHAPVTISFNA